MDAAVAAVVAAVAGRRRRRRCGRGGGESAADMPDGTPRAAGFGVRVIHSGVWGFASSPIVTEDEIRRITRVAMEVARASAIAKKTDVRLAPVPAYQVYWRTAMKKDPMTMSADRQASGAAGRRRRGDQAEGRRQRHRLGELQHRVEVLRLDGRLLHRTGAVRHDAELQRHGAGAAT